MPVDTRSSACSSCSIAGRSRWLVGSSSTSRLTPRACSSASAARVRSPGDSVAAGRSTWSAPQPELRQQRAHVGRRAVRHRRRRTRRSSGSSPRNSPRAWSTSPTTTPGPSAAVPASERRAGRAARASSVDLPEPFGAGDRDPVGPVDLQVDRAERERAAAHHRAAQRRDDGAGARCRGDLHPQLPLLARLLDDLEPLDQPLGLPGLGGLLLARLGAEPCGRSCRCRSPCGARCGRPSPSRRAACGRAPRAPSACRRTPRTPRGRAGGRPRAPRGRPS